LSDAAGLNARHDDGGAWVIAADAREGAGTRLRELWQYRRVLVFFSLKAVQSLYAKTRLGWPWLVIRVLVPLAAGSLIFGGVMEVPSGAVPYFIFFATGQLAWNCFDGPLIRGSRGIEVNRELLRKLYLPRMILPLGQLTAGLVEPAIIALVLAGAAVYYRATDLVWYIHPGWGIGRAVLAALLILAFAFALSLWTSVWQARTRDVRFVLRYVVGFWMYFTPVIYPLSILPAELRWLAYLNPLTAPVEMFKSGILPDVASSWPWFGYSAAVTLLVFGGGTWHFRRTESATMDTL
jgi:lipopolysaccharide transport system permease protein